METFDSVKSMAGSHSTHSMEAFGLSKYIEKDHSEKKNDAMRWGRGDFKSMVRESMKGYRDGTKD